MKLPRRTRGPATRAAIWLVDIQTIVGNYGPRNRYAPAQVRDNFALSKSFGARCEPEVSCRARGTFSSGGVASHQPFPRREIHSPPHTGTNPPGSERAELPPQPHRAIASATKKLHDWSCGTGNQRRVCSAGYVRD